MIGPASGIKQNKQLHPDLLISCNLLTINANVGTKTANEYSVETKLNNPAKSGMIPEINPNTKPIKKFAKHTHQ